MIFVGCDKHEEKRIDAENRGKFLADFGLLGAKRELRPSG